MTQIHRPARLATRAASFRYGGRHHSGIPGGIIPLYPGDFVGIRYVLAQSPSPEAAKITISTARRNGQLRLRAEVREHEASPDLTLSPGERPPQIQPKREPERPILASDEFRTWDWERSYATRRDATTKSLFEYLDIVANRDDVLGLRPSAEMTVTAGTPETAMIKPDDVSGLVWAAQGDVGGRALSISQFCFTTSPLSVANMQSFHCRDMFY